MTTPLASGSLDSFFHSVDQFFANLAAVRWGSLLLGLICFAGYLVLRSRAIFNAMRAAYPDETFQWRRIWGAYVATVGFKNVVPIGGANVIQLFLTKSSIPNSTFAAVGAALTTGAIFDGLMFVVMLVFAFTQGVFPKPPDFSKLNAFDLSYFASHVQFTIFLLTALAILAIVAVALLSARVKAFWVRVRQGYSILRPLSRWRREMVPWQAGAWVCRLTTYYFMLQAFRVGGSVRNALLVQASEIVATIVPLTPGGAGVQQALLVTVFAKNAPGATVAAYSVGQQIAIAAFALLVGFTALVVIFRIRSFKEVIRQGKEEKAAEAAAQASTPAA